MKDRAYAEKAAWSAPVFFLVILPPLYRLNEVMAVIFCEIAAVIYAFSAFPAFLQKRQLLKSVSKSLHRFYEFFWALTSLWLICVGCSILTSECPTASFAVYLKLLALVLIVWASLCFADETDWFKYTAAAAALAALFHGAFAVAEYYEAAPMPATWVDPAMRDIIRTRCAGFFIDPNVFGAYVAALLPWLISGMFISSKEGDKKTTVFFALSFMAGGIALLLTFSRGAYLAAIAGIVVFGGVLRQKLLEIPNFGWIAAAVSCIVLLSVFFIGPFKLRFFSIVNTQDMTLSQRTLINRGIFSAAAKVPWTGYGLHTFSQVYPRFRCVGGDYPLNAHNEFLQTFIECGLPAAIFLLLLSLCVGWAALKLAVTPLNDFKIAAASAPASFAVFFVHNLSGFSSRILPTAAFMAMVTGGVIGSLYRLAHANTAANFEKLEKRNSKILYILIIILLALYLFLAINSGLYQLTLQKISDDIGQGRLKEAKEKLAELSKTHFKDPVFHLLAAKVAENVGDITGALRHIESGITVNPTEALFYIEKARLFELLGRVDEALEAVRCAVKLDPASEQFRLYAARLLNALGRSREALSELDAALKTSPGFHEVYRTYLEVEKMRNEILQSLNSASSTANRF